MNFDFICDKVKQKVDPIRGGPLAKWREALYVELCKDPKTYCAQFQKDSSTNPFTNRAIKADSKVGSFFNDVLDAMSHLPSPKKDNFDQIKAYVNEQNKYLKVQLANEQNKLIDAIQEEIQSLSKEQSKLETRLASKLDAFSNQSKMHAHDAGVSKDQYRVLQKEFDHMSKEHDKLLTKLDTTLKQFKVHVNEIKDEVSKEQKRLIQKELASFSKANDNELKDEILKKAAAKIEYRVDEIKEDILKKMSIVQRHFDELLKQKIDNLPKDHFTKAQAAELKGELAGEKAKLEYLSKHVAEMREDILKKIDSLTKHVDEISKKDKIPAKQLESLKSELFDYIHKYADYNQSAYQKKTSFFGKKETTSPRAEKKQQDEQARKAEETRRAEAERKQKQEEARQKAEEAERKQQEQTKKAAEPSEVINKLKAFYIETLKAKLASGEQIGKRFVLLTFHPDKLPIHIKDLVANSPEGRVFTSRVFSALKDSDIITLASLQRVLTKEQNGGKRQVLKKKK